MEGPDSVVQPSINGRKTKATVGRRKRNSTKRQNDTVLDPNSNEADGNDKKRIKTNQNVQTPQSNVTVVVPIWTGSKLSIWNFTNSQPAVTKALQNPLILSKIMSYFGDKILLRCRLVACTWNDLSTSILLKKQSIQLSFKVSDIKSVPEHYMLKQQQHPVYLTLSSLNNCLKEATNFPCVNFSFANTYLRCPDLQEFLHIYGKSIKILSIDLGSNNKTVNYHGKDNYQKYFTTEAVLRTLLVEQAPNIEKLYIDDFPSSCMKSYYVVPKYKKINKNNKKANNKKASDSDDGDSTSNNNNNNTTVLQKLPNLKVLNVRYDSAYEFPILAEILRGAINLCHFEGFDLERLDLFQLVNKLNTITKFKFEPTDDNLGLYESFAAGNNLKINKLIFSTEFIYENSSLWHRVASIFTDLLEKNKNTITSIKFECPISLHLLYLIKWPQLKRVRKFTWIVEIARGSDDPYSLFRQLPFSKVFPSLHTVILNYAFYVRDENLLLSSFPKMNSIPSVKVLELHQRPPQAACENLHQLFPSVQKLKLVRLDNFLQISSSIWNFVNVRHLDIHVMLGDGSTSIELESAFSGFEKETVRQIKANLSKNINHEDTCEDIEDLRVKPSILNLKELEYFKIEIDNRNRSQKGGRDSRESELCNLGALEVSRIYAWGRMKQDPRVKVFSQPHRVSSVFC